MEAILGALAVYLSGSTDPVLINKLSKLIRFRPKDLPEADIVLPTLEVWKKCIADEELSLTKFEDLLGTENDNLNLVNSSVPNPWRFSKIFQQNEKISMKCDRPFLMSNFLPQLLKSGRHTFEPLPHPKSVKIVNCELSMTNNQQSAVFCQLSEVRCNQVTKNRESLNVQILSVQYRYRDTLLNRYRYSTSAITEAPLYRHRDPSTLKKDKWPRK